MLAPSRKRPMPKQDPTSNSTRTRHFTTNSLADCRKWNPFWRSIGEATPSRAIVDTRRSSLWWTSSLTPGPADPFRDRPETLHGGSAIAVSVSWSLYHSLVWAIVHGIFGWFYVIYYALTRR
jgi:hypothetical protein